MAIHRTNGCTYGATHACDSHSGMTRDLVMSYTRIQVVKARKASPTERWGKHWAERRERPMPKYMAEISQYRPVKATYEGPGYLIRRKLTK